MQVMPPLHAPQVHTHLLTVGYTIPTLSGGEFLAVKCHRASPLGQLSTHSNNTRISGHTEGLYKVRQCQCWCCCQLLLKQLKCLLLSITPDKLT